MGRIWLWVSVALVVLLCRQFSFWAVFGWAYAAASLGLVVVCFTYRRRERKEVSNSQVAPIRVQSLEVE